MCKRDLLRPLQSLFLKISCAAVPGVDWTPGGTQSVLGRLVNNPAGRCNGRGESEKDPRFLQKDHRLKYQFLDKAREMLPGYLGEQQAGKEGGKSRSTRQ